MTPSIWQLLIVLVIVLLLFGRGKIPQLMGDMAKGIKSFKKGMSEEEKKNMEDWNLTAETMMSKDQWKAFFEENNFNGDYYWFIP